jgi:tetratricopeptide (TPR) repeat protein
MSEINLLESEGRYDQALRKYEHAMTYHPELISLYETLKQLLSNRMMLAQKRTQRINASPLRAFEANKEVNTI